MIVFGAKVQHHFTDHSSSYCSLSLGNSRQHHKQLCRRPLRLANVMFDLVYDFVGKHQRHFRTSVVDCCAKKRSSVYLLHQN